MDPLPKEVMTVLTMLTEGGFEAYTVGGCVRDLLLGQKPADWDITTSAHPEDIQRLCPRNYYNNKYGTVTILTDSHDPSLKEIEVTTYRIDKEYSDFRHPDSVTFSSSLTEDLSRRDFTINAIALNDETITDPFDGQKDLEERTIRSVGNPDERIAEDPLRLLRAIRFVGQLGFTIESNTRKAIYTHAALLQNVSKERIRDELNRLVMSDNPEAGFQELEHTGLLGHILPELAEGVGVEQNKHHIYTVFEHNIKSLQFASQFDYPLHIRLAALFHDVGKPRTKRIKGNDYTFYAHDIVGAKMTESLMRRLRFDNALISNVAHLIRHHMFYYDIGKVTETGARRLLRRIGKEHFDDLIKVRIAERKGSGVPKAEPYRLRHLQFLVEKAAQEPISVSQLAINGNDLMKELPCEPGPLIGGILNALLAEVLQDPAKNTQEYLLSRSRILIRQDPATLKSFGEAAAEQKELEREEKIRRKYRV